MSGNETPEDHTKFPPFKNATTAFPSSGPGLLQDEDPGAAFIAEGTAVADRMDAAVLRMESAQADVAAQFDWLKGPGLREVVDEAAERVQPRILGEIARSVDRLVLNRYRSGVMLFCGLGCMSVIFAFMLGMLFEDMMKPRQVEFIQVAPSHSTGSPSGSFKFKSAENSK